MSLVALASAGLGFVIRGFVGHGAAPSPAVAAGVNRVDDDPEVDPPQAARNGAKR